MAHGCFTIFGKNNTKLCKEVVSLIDELPIGCFNDETSIFQMKKKMIKQMKKKMMKSDQESDLILSRISVINHPIINRMYQNMVRLTELKKNKLNSKLNKLNYLFKKRKLNNLLCLINF